MEEQQKKPYVEEYKRAWKIYEKKLSQYNAVNPEAAEDEGRSEKEWKMKKVKNYESLESGKRRREFEEKQSKVRKKKAELEDLEEYEL